jgi:hypothetical protein
VFGNRVISRRLWTSRSPDLTPGDYYFWDNFKDIMNPHIEEELKENNTKRRFGSSSGRTFSGEFQPIYTAQNVRLYRQRFQYVLSTLILSL